MKRLSVLLVIGAASFALLGCDEDGSAGNLRPGGSGAPIVSNPPDSGETDPGPVQTAAPTPDPPPEVTPPANPDTGETPPANPDTSEPNPVTPESSDIVPIVFGVALLVLAAGLIGALISRKSKAAAPATNSAAPSQQVALLTNAQWIHDHLTLELLAAPPADALQRWATERRRLDDVSIGAQQEWANGHGDPWSTLSRTMTTLATALDTNLRLRAQVPPDPTLIQESTAVVNRQRATLIQLVASLWAVVQSTPPTR